MSSKLKFFVFVFILCIGLSVKAQKFDAGIIGGLSTSQVSGDNLSGFSQFGLILGGLVTTKLSDKFSAQFEIMYIQKGSKSNVDSLNPNYYYLKLHYMEVPLLVRYHYKKLALEFGPSVSFLIGSDEKDNYGTIVELPFNRLEASLNLGLNYPIYQNLFFNFRLEQSISAIRQHASMETKFLNRGQYNSLINYSLRYYFNSHKS